MPIFRESRFRARCEQCRAVFAVGQGGVCHRCRAVLCDGHLHGSVFRKLVRAIVGSEPVCGRCAAADPVAHHPA